MKHADDDPVMVGYSSSRNVSFTSSARGDDDLGVTWGEWREMTEKQRDELVSEYLFQLVDVYVVEDEN